MDSLSDDLTRSAVRRLALYRMELWLNSESTPSTAAARAANPVPFNP